MGKANRTKKVIIQKLQQIADKLPQASMRCKSIKARILRIKLR